MPIRSFEVTPELDSFIDRQVESGAFESADRVVKAALELLEREAEDDKWKLLALEEAIDEGEASGVAEGDVFADVRRQMELPSRLAADLRVASYEDARDDVEEAFTSLTREEPDDGAKMRALIQAIDEGEASGLAEGGVLERIREARRLRRQQPVALG